VLALTCGDESTIGEHDVRFEEVVDREAVDATQVPMAAAECQACDPCSGDNAGGNG
jgi:hypothetical protein